MPGPDGTIGSTDRAPIHEGYGVKDQKAFGIGFHKTDTTTFKSAFTTLGYTVAPRFRIEGEIVETDLVSQALQIAATVDAVQDNP